VRQPPAGRRRRLLLPAGIVALLLVLLISGAFSSPRSFAPPGRANLAGMSVGQRIVAFADSQVGYSTDPSNSYCNKFSAYWNVGSPSCPGAESSEEWCADFAAWAWRQAGVPFSYGFGPDELNAAAASFYEWGVAHGTWHSAYSGYRAAPGDVAVYGLSLGSSASASHVAIVTSDPRGQEGPDVINGDGDRTGFSVVETGTDQLRADAGHGQGAPLAGYVSP
jgi:CHAP domain